MDSKLYFHFDSPVGRVYVAESDGVITDVSYKPIIGVSEKETPLIARTIIMLCEYFEGSRKTFDELPLNPVGTEFQKKAWNALLKIPYGETRSYEEQAMLIGNAKAYRAVGNANSKNPISIIIPCHRVIGKNKKLVGYGGGLDVKRFLLELEGN